MTQQGKCSYSLPCQQLDEEIDTTLNTCPLNIWAQPGAGYLSLAQRGNNKAAPA